MGKNPLLKVVILGDGGVGKSCLMNRYISNDFDESSFHTIGVEILSKEITVKGSNYVLQIWDTAGQEKFKSLRTPFYRGSDMCILVCSVDDKKSLENLSFWIKEFLTYGDVKDATNFPFVLLANKIDVGSDKWELTKEELDEWSAAHGDLPHLFTSAKTAENVPEAFALAVEAWSALENERQPIPPPETINLNTRSNEAEKRTCC